MFHDLGRTLAGRILKCSLSLAAGAVLTTSLHAQISVSAAGSLPETFDSLPLASSWSTAESGTDHQYTTEALQDAAVQTFAASGIAAQVGNNTGTPPLATARLAQWSSVGLYLQTRPTGNGMILLMATLQNDSGGTVTAMTINYDLAIAVAPAGEVIPGHRVYYNLSGAANNWIPLGDFGNAGTQTIPVDLSATPWAPGSPMYILLVDNNATTNPDGAYDIDNFAISGVVGGVVTCPGITNQPQNVVLPQCPAGSATFSISATGTVQGLQWFRDDGAGFNPIAGANGSSYTIPSVVPSDNGARFQAIATNFSCSATSDIVTLTITPDTTRPTVIYAVGYANPTNINLTNIMVVFSEPIVFSLPDVGGNFQLTDTNNGNPVDLLSATAPTPDTLLIETAPRDPTHGYVLNVDFVQDVCGGNDILNTNVVVYTFESTPLALTATWKYLDNDIDPAANWPLPGFDDSTWLLGSGPFDAKRSGVGTAPYQGDANNCRPQTYYMMQGPTPTCLLLTSPVTGTNLMAAYFRAHFNYTGDTNQTLLQLSGKFDDAGIVYLNGVEMARFGFPAAPAVITKSTATTRTVGDGDGRDIELFVATPALHNGDNLVAVELNQQSLTSSDLTMGLELNAFTVVALASAVQPQLQITLNGGDVTVTWAGGGTLQRSSDISSPLNWTDIPGATSGFQTNVSSGSPLFFQVKVQ